MQARAGGGGGGGGGGCEGGELSNESSPAYDKVHTSFSFISNINHNYSFRLYGLLILLEIKNTISWQ